MRWPTIQVDCRLGPIIMALALVLAADCLTGLVPGAAAALDFPQLTGRVVDEAGVLDAATKSALDSKLAALEAQTTDQLVVVTLKTLRGTTIETYGYQLGRHWGIGQKGKNNGALLIIAPTERKIRIEVGYGLEDRLTDAVTRLIIENAIAPRLRKNDFAGGISRGVDDIISVLTEDPQDWQRRAEAYAARRANHVGGSFDAVVGVFVVVVFFIILMSMFSGMSGPGGRLRGSRRQPGWFGPVILPPGGPFGSGSSGSGDSGGFSGGGGDFGGGGASGDY